MAYQLSTLQSRVQQRIKDTGFSTSEITTYLNETQYDIFNEYRLPFMEATQTYTLTVDNADITGGSDLPPNFVQGIDIILTTSGKEQVLKYKSYQEIDALYPDSTDTTAHPSGIPQFWYMFGQTIRVFPAPSDAFTVTLRYYKKPTELSAITDVPDIPIEFGELLVVGAAYRVLQVKDNYDQAAILENKYNELLRKLTAKYSLKQAGHATRMRINRYAVGK